MQELLDLANIESEGLKASWHPYQLNFKVPGGTSRGVLKTKDTWFIKIWRESNPQVFGIGECGMFRGLSIDDVPDYENKLSELCTNIEMFPNYLSYGLLLFPSIQFGLETALLDLENGGKRKIISGSFQTGANKIRINGLIWMGALDFLKEQISKKLEGGFTCLKLKIGSLPFEEEIKVLEELRKNFSADKLELRVDANGAYELEEAKEVLKALRTLSIHSIEQPIKQGNWKDMAELCEARTCPIALDEELIGIHEMREKRGLLNFVRPAYIILKPTLVGGMSGTMEWIEVAEAAGVKWWITSALESNIGLNAIAQFTAKLLEEKPQRVMPQGLGTGQLFTNNIASPLSLQSEYLFYDQTEEWSIPEL